MSQPSQIVGEILSRIDRLTAVRPELSPAKLSKELFGSGHALGELRSGTRDVLSRTAEDALQKLKRIQRQAPRRRRGR